MNFKQFIFSTFFAFLLGVCAHVEARVYQVNAGPSKNKNEESPFKTLGEKVGDDDIDFDSGSSNSTEGRDLVTALVVAGNMCTVYGGMCYVANGCSLNCGWYSWFGCKECKRTSQIKEFKCTSGIHKYIQKGCQYVTWADVYRAPQKIINWLNLL